MPRTLAILALGTASFLPITASATSPATRGDPPDSGKSADSQAIDEIVGLELQGPKRWRKLKLDDLDALRLPSEKRLLPLLRLLEALGVEHGFRDDTLTFSHEGYPPTFLDTKRGTVTSGNVTRPIEVTRAVSEITGEEDLYVPVEAIATLLSMELEWKPLEYAFAGRTSIKWPIWTSTSLRDLKVQQAENLLPELVPRASPRRSGLDFLEFQTRAQARPGPENPSNEVDLQSVRTTLWGTLFGGNLRVRLFAPTVGASETRDNLPPVSLESGNWRYPFATSEVAIGDAVIGLSDLTFPSAPFFGLRFSGVVGGGAAGDTDRSGRGLRRNFSRPRVFEGLAPLGSKVDLVIDGQTVDTRRVFASVSAPTGSGYYRFDAVVLRPGRLNDIRIVVTEPDGSTRETRNVIVESPLLAPKGALAFLAGTGTDRERLSNDMNGWFAGARFLYGITNRLTLGGTIAGQGDLYRRLPENTDRRRYPEQSQHSGLQLVWLPWKPLLVTLDAAGSRAPRDMDGAYDDLAYRVALEAYPARGFVFRSQAFRFGTNYFNGRNLELQDREGVVLDGRFRGGGRWGLDYAVGRVRDNVEGATRLPLEADFFHAAVSTGAIPGTWVSVEYDRLDPTWTPEPRSGAGLRLRTRLARRLLLDGNVTIGDDLTGQQTNDFFSGLNLPGLSIFQQDSRSVTIRKLFSGSAACGLSYLENDVKKRSTLFGSARFRMFGRPVNTSSELGYDLLESAAFSSFPETRFPYFNSNIDLLIDELGKSRIGLQSRFERDRWNITLVASFMMGVDDRLRTRFVRSRVSPEVGGVHGRVFLDYNANGLRDHGEPGLPDVRVSLDTGRNVESGRHGYFALSGPAIEQEAKVFLDVNSVPATYSVTHGMQTAQLVPGRMTTVNLGVTPLISITGRVVALDESDRALPLSSVRVYLTDTREGRPIVDSITGGDGSFYLGGVTPGEYALDIDPATLPADHRVSELRRLIKIIPQTDAQEIAVSAFFARKIRPERGPSDPKVLREEP